MLNPTPAAKRRYALPLALLLAAGLSGCGHLPGGGKHRPVTPTHGNRIPILSRIDTSARLDPALEAVAVIVPPAAANAEWPQAGGAASKSYGNLALAASPTRAWAAKIAGSTPKARLAAAPVIGGGELFVIDTGGVLHAFDVATGSERWRHNFDVKGPLGNSIYGGGASYADGKIYVTTGIGDVAALDDRIGIDIGEHPDSGGKRGSRQRV